MTSSSVPTNFSVPATIPSGRCVVSRITNTGLPRLGASCKIPPLHVTYRKYPLGLQPHQALFHPERFSFFLEYLWSRGIMSVLLS